MVQSAEAETDEREARETDREGTWREERKDETRDKKERWKQTQHKRKIEEKCVALMCTYMEREGGREDEKGDRAETGGRERTGRTEERRAEDKTIKGGGRRATPGARPHGSTSAQFPCSIAGVHGRVHPGA